MKIKIAANEITDGEVDFVSLVKRGANRSPFKIVKSDDAIQELAARLTEIAEQLAKRDKELDALLAQVKQPVVDTGRFAKNARDTVQNDRVRELLNKREVLEQRLEQVWESGDLDGRESQLRRAIEKTEESLAALGHTGQRVTSLDDIRHNSFFQTGGSSTFLQASGSTFSEVMTATANRRHGVSKADDENSINLNCLVL